ncbi:MAG: hypothetical protein AAFY69_04170 [Pseudomonadota bacterium]
MQRQFLFSIVLAALVGLTASASGYAQEELSDDREILERDVKAQAMSEPIYKRLSAIHELMGEDQNAEAMQRSQALLENGRMNNYERALVLQAVGFIHANENRIEPAIDFFEQSLALNALQAQAQQGMLYSLASLYAAEGKFMKAIETAREWFKYEADPKADAYMLIGSSFAQLEDYVSARPYVERAIARSDKPNEPWYQLLLAIHFETKQIPKAVPLLQQMVELWPDKERYWETLSGAHMELDQDRPALATMMVAYHKGMITEEDKLLSLVRLNMFLDIPFTGGQILEDGLDAGQIERKKETLTLLEQAWTAAQEYDKALAVMAELGELTGDPEYAIRQAKIYNELTRWEDVIASANRALEQGYDDEGDAYLLIGTAYSEMGRLRDSLAAFKQAEDSGDADQRKNARAWIGFVNDRLKIAS